MVPLEILEFPDPRLRTVAKPVTEVNGKIVEMADRMLETMYHAPGIGLAAPQVGAAILPKRPNVLQMVLLNRWLSNSRNSPTFWLKHKTKICLCL